MNAAPRAATTSAWTRTGASAAAGPRTAGGTRRNGRRGTAGGTGGTGTGARRASWRRRRGTERRTGACRRPRRSRATGCTVAEIATSVPPEVRVPELFHSLRNDNTEVPLLASPEQNRAVLRVRLGDHRVDVGDILPAHVGTALGHQPPRVALRGAEGGADEQVHDPDPLCQLRARDLDRGNPGEVARPRLAARECGRATRPPPSARRRRPCTSVVISMARRRLASLIRWSFAAHSSVISATGRKVKRSRNWLHVRVRDVHPVLVELVRAGHVRDRGTVRRSRTCPSSCRPSG